MKHQALFIAGVLACAAIASAYAGHESMGSKPQLAAEAHAQAEAAVAAAPSQPPEDSIVPIVVYHVVRPAQSSDSAAVKKLAVTPELFDEHLSYLEAEHYTVIRFSQLEDHL